jgi:SAM-dependent methyltransferase
MDNNFEYIVCDYCGNDKTKLLAKQTDLIHKTTNDFFSVVQCNKCGLAYTNPRPKKRNMHNYYSNSYSFYSSLSTPKKIFLSIVVFVANFRYFPAFILPSLISTRMSRYVSKRIKDPIRSFFQKEVGGTIIDIGCGSGQHAHHWGTKGSLVSYSRITKVYGVDISETARTELSKCNIESWSDIDEVPKNLIFRVIRLNWSLEHVYNPSRYFEFIQKRLSKDGIAVIGVPNYDGLIYKMNKSCVELPIHLYHFRPQDIQNYADKYKLSIMNSETFSYPQMFIEASKLGMIVSSFSEQLLLGEARSLQNILNKLDSEKMGNDIVIILKHVVP